MKELFVRRYAENGNKVIPMKRKYVGLKTHWNNMICGCNGSGGCDACDDQTGNIVPWPEAKRG